MRQFNDRGESCCGRRELCDPAGRALVPPPPPCCCNAVSVHCAEVERGRGSRRSPLQQQHGEEWSDVGEVGLGLGGGLHKEVGGAPSADRAVFGQKPCKILIYTLRFCHACQV